MNKANGTFLAGLVMLIAAIATNGTKFAEGMHAVWLFVIGLTDTAPLGLSSFLLATGLAVGAQAMLARWLPLFKCAKSRDLVTDVAAFAVGFGVMWLQTRGQADPAARLNGLLLGALAGFMAPYVFKAVAAIVAMAVRKMQKETTG